MRRSVVSRYSIIVLAILLLFLSCKTGGGKTIPLAVVFGGWYGYDPVTGNCKGGLGSTHWNDSPDTGGVVYTPAMGFYCSADPEVVAWQLGMMQEAGISVVLYSWWGWGDGDLDGEIERHPDQYINSALTEMLAQIHASDSDFKVALIVEPFTGTQSGVKAVQLTQEQRQDVLDYVWDRYYSKYPDQMFRWDGSPLLVTFDPMLLPEDDRYTIRKWTGRMRDQFTENEGWEWFFAPPQDVLEAMSDDGVVFVYPRFDESYLVQGGATYITWAARRVDPWLEEGVYEAQWQQVSDIREDVGLIVLYGWNLYGEQAQIEPSFDGPAPVGFEYVARTGQ